MAADGSAKITNFGLAKWLAGDSGLTGTDSIMGSPSYMAPDQAEGRTHHAGPAADVYSLGAILYELLTARPPFRGATVLETLEQAKTTEPVPPSRLVPGLPRDFETIALKCLQKEPGKRYESATALVDDLKRFIDGRPIVARRVSQTERTDRWCKRNPAVAGLLGTVAVLLVAGFAGAVAAALTRSLLEREMVGTRWVCCLCLRSEVAAFPGVCVIAATWEISPWFKRTRILMGPAAVMFVVSSFPFGKTLQLARAHGLYGDLAPTSRSITFHHGENAGLPGSHVEGQASPLQVIAIPVEAGRAELIPQQPFLSGEIRERQSDMALALIGGIVHGDH